jgi:cell division protein ZapA
MTNPQSGVVQVRIYDRDYALRTSGDPARLRQICAHLDERMRRISASSGAVDTLKVAILTAISVADDLLRVQEELVKMDESVSRRSRECVSMLDRFL